jgi:hypothetical protein
MVQLLYLILATLATWDILRRLLPTRVPVVVGKLLLVVIAWVLLKYAHHDILLTLSVSGVLLLISRLVPADVYHWGPYVADYWRIQRRRQVRASGVGHRVPRV